MVITVSTGKQLFNYLCLTVLICLCKLDGGPDFVTQLSATNEKWLLAFSGLAEAGLEQAVVGLEAVEGCLVNGPKLEPGVRGVCGWSSRSP